MKKNNKTDGQNSSFFFKIVLTAVFICAFAFVWFAGYVYADTNFQTQREKTNIVIVMEPKGYEAPAVIIEDEPILNIQAQPAHQIIEAEQSAVSPSEPELNPSYEEPAAKVVEAEQSTVSPSEPESKPAYIAVVIDDMGISPNHTKEILSMHIPITSAFLTYGHNLSTLVAQAIEAGHEVIMHTPMEPEGAANLAPDTLKVSMSDDEIKSIFLSMLSKFDGIDVKGINNHMGSLFTESAEKLDVVMSILKEKEMYFLDSKTSKYSQGENVAAMEGVDYIARDVFLDNENDYEKITTQLKKAEKIAHKRGYAVAIGHPKSKTFLALRDWFETLEKKGIKLIHLSEMIALKKAENK